MSYQDKLNENQRLKNALAALNEGGMSAEDLRNSYKNLGSHDASDFHTSMGKKLTWTVHVDSDAVKGSPKSDHPTHRNNALKSHLKTIGMGHHEVYHDAYTSSHMIDNLNKSDATKIVNHLGSKYPRPSKGYGDHHDTSHAVTGEEMETHHDPDDHDETWQDPTGPRMHPGYPKGDPDEIRMD